MAKAKSVSKKAVKTVKPVKATLVKKGTVKKKAAPKTAVKQAVEKKAVKLKVVPNQGVKGHRLLTAEGEKRRMLQRKGT